MTAHTDDFAAAELVDHFDQFGEFYLDNLLIYVRS